jgi:NDP-sugar pyrophosphorylase family protein
LHAIILAGGNGVRLRSVTAAAPKALAAVGGQPLLEVIVRQLREADFTRVTLCVSYQSEMIEEALGDGARFGLTIDYCRDAVPLGTAGPLRLVTDWNSTALIMNCDILTSVDVAGMVRSHRDSGAVLTVGYRVCPVPVDFGMLELSAGGKVIGIREKPSIEVAVASGIYAADPQVRTHLPEGKPMDMPELINALAGRDYPVRAAHLEGHWHDIGTPDRYGAAKRAFDAHPDVFLGCRLTQESPRQQTAGQSQQA